MRRMMDRDANVAGVSPLPVCEDVLSPDEEFVPLTDIAAHLGLPVSRVHQMIRDGKGLAIRRDRIVGVPRALLDDNFEFIKHLSGVITVLRDGGFGDSEILAWIYRPDEVLEAAPITVLHSQLARDVVRRAQAMAF